MHGEIPAGAEVGFGARAIINRPSTYPDGACYLDLPPDRFGYTPDEGRDGEVEALSKFVVAAMREVRRRVRAGEPELTDFRANVDVTITLAKFPGYKLVANQRCSHGYLYINAWKEAQGDAGQ